MSELQKIIIEPKETKQTSLYQEVDDGILLFLKKRLDNCDSLTEVKKISDLISIHRGKYVQDRIKIEEAALKIKEKKSNLFFKKIRNIITITIGVGLFASSFFLFSIYPIIAGIFFSTGLGALGLKAISNKLFSN